MAEVNFLPNPASPIETPPFFYSDSTIAGSGSPEGVVPAWPGTHYTDRDSGDTYIKQSGDGTMTGWAAEGGGGGGGGGGTTITTAGVWSASGVPAHTPTVDQQLYIDTDDGTKHYWYLGGWH